MRFTESVFFAVLARLVSAAAIAQPWSKASEMAVIESELNSTKTLEKRGICGEASWYYVGGAHGSCGRISTDDEFVVAVSPGRVNCGSKVKVSSRGHKHVAYGTVVDTCKGCTGQRVIDVSPALFKKFASTPDGVFHAC